MSLINTAFAATPGANGAANSGLSTILFFVAFFAIFYFLFIRPQSKRAKEQKMMLANLAKGDEVMTAGGILGKINQITDNYVSLEIAPNIEIKIQKSAISQNLPKGTLKSVD